MSQNTQNESPGSQSDEDLAPQLGTVDRHLYPTYAAAMDKLTASCASMGPPPEGVVDQETEDECLYKVTAVWHEFEIATRELAKNQIPPRERQLSLRKSSLKMKVLKSALVNNYSRC